MPQFSCTVEKEDGTEVVISVDAKDCDEAADIAFDLVDDAVGVSDVQ